MCLLCHVANRVGKSFTDSRREQLEVHNSLSVKMESASPFSWSVSFSCPVAGQGGLRQHLCKFPAFVSTWNGFTWLLVNPAPPPHVSDILAFPFLTPHHTTPLYPHPITITSTSFLNLTAFLLSQGLTDTRHQQVLWPGWIRFPICQEIVLHTHIYGLVLHSWRISAYLWCSAMSDNH